MNLDSERDQDDFTTQLFTVRLWPEKTGDLSVEWRGEVKHISTGQKRYFLDWSSMVAFLTRQISLPGGDDPNASPPPDLLPPNRD